MPRMAGAIVAMLCCTSSLPARAAGAADPAAAPAASWYGWQTLATNGGAAALLLGALAFGEARADGAAYGLLGLSLATFALGGPIVHGVHRHGGKAAVSAGLRVGLSCWVARSGSARATPPAAVTSSTTKVAPSATLLWAPRWAP
jgi:hypothetical protein